MKKLNLKYIPNSLDWVLELVEDGYVLAEELLTMCLKYMSTYDVEYMLDCNKLSERFMDEKVDYA